MSEIITVINMKGGVGKTTLSVHTAYCLARYHAKKVLLVDIDPQFNATQYLLKYQQIIDHFRTKKTCYDILVPKKEEDISLVKPIQKAKKATPINLSDFIAPIHKYPNGGQLDLIPSSLKFCNFGSENRVEKRLKLFLNNHCKHYDIIMIDCPPTLSVLTLSAYLASKYYLVPIKPDYLSSLGLPILESGLADYEENEGHSLTLLGIVFTMVPGNNLAQTTMNDIIESKRKCFSGLSSHSTIVAKSVSSLDNFYKKAANKRYADQFKGITNELVNNL